MYMYEIVAAQQNADVLASATSCRERAQRAAGGPERERENSLLQLRQAGASMILHYLFSGLAGAIFSIT